MKLFRLVLCTAALLAVAGPARASGPPEAGCSAFPWVQTYRDWGPAEHYGSTVTVVYEAASCSASETEGTARLEASGTATVVKGKDASGEVVDTRGFSNTATWVDPEGEGWPIRWWSCEVEELTYDWSIEGVYEFSVRAEGGSWSIRVTPGSVDWSYSSC